NICRAISAPWKLSVPRTALVPVSGNRAPIRIGSFVAVPPSLPPPPQAAVATRTIPSRGANHLTRDLIASAPISRTEYFEDNCVGLADTTADRGDTDAATP